MRILPFHRCAGLVPAMELAEQNGLSALLVEHVQFTCAVVKSGAANPTPKLTSIIAGLAAGADCIDDLDVIRAGGTKQLSDGVSGEPVAKAGSAPSNEDTAGTEPAWTRWRVPGPGPDRAF